MEHSGITFSPQGGCSKWQSRQVTAVWCRPPLLAIDAGASWWHLTQSATSRETNSAFASWAKAVNMAATMTAAHKKPNREYFFLSIILAPLSPAEKLTYHSNILSKKNEWSFIIRQSKPLSSVKNMRFPILKRFSQPTEAHLKWIRQNSTELLMAIYRTQGRLSFSVNPRKYTYLTTDK
jgi:hypothetical protein